MRLLGVDPGETTGWCVYQHDSLGITNRILDAGFFAGTTISGAYWEYLRSVDVVVLERPKGMGPTRPQLVECGITFGYLLCQAEAHAQKAAWILRKDVCKRLTAASYGQILVRNDATAWAALVAMHGDGSDKKAKTKKGVVVQPAGSLGLATSHARAAAAVAVAYTLPV